MEKIYLDNFYKNSATKHPIMALGIPLSIIHKHIFNKNNTMLQEKYNLSLSEGDVLFSLYFNDKVLSPTDLYKTTILSSGGMTKILKKLQEKNYISRVSSPNDKRSMLVKLEKKGEELIEDSLENITGNYNDIFSILEDDEKKTFEKILKKLVYSLDK